MKISILTLFPEMFQGPFDYSILKRAKEKNIITVEIVNIRDFASDAYKTVDDKPYGGGTGMILKVDIIDKAIKSQKSLTQSSGQAKVNPPAGGQSSKTILLTPQGEPYCQKIAKELATVDHLILICGHYEGYDERIRNLVDMELSVGDYILTGGEIPAMTVVDSVVRLQPGIFTKEGVTNDESFGDNGLLEYPQYTKPLDFEGNKVPDVLLSGNHAEIIKWKEEESIKRTRLRRPDLLKSTP